MSTPRFPALRSLRFLWVGFAALLGLDSSVAAAEPGAGLKAGGRELRAWKESARAVFPQDAVISPADREKHLTRLRAAGTRLLPVLTHLVGDSDFPFSGVDAAARFAAQLPFSQALHDALRKRRNDLAIVRMPGPPLGLSTYFAEHGDTIDYVWMEKLRDRLGPAEGAPLAPFLKKMVDRLSG